MAKGAAKDSSKQSPKGAVTQSKTFREGAIYLYQRSDFKKPTWLCRIKVPNTRGYVTRSAGIRGCGYSAAGQNWSIQNQGVKH